MRSADVLAAGTEVASLEVVPEPPPSHVAFAPPPEVARGSSERLANVERLRLVAMFEIVAFHVSGAMDDAQLRLPLIGGLGLPAFLLLNNAFNCTLAERMGARAFLRVKVSRLLLPWMVWSAIYGLLLVAERLHHDEPLDGIFTSWMIIGGTYDHLWFVPFALFGGALVAWLQNVARPVRSGPVVWGTLAIGLLVTAIAALGLSTPGIEWPVTQWLFALPSPIVGFSVGRALLSGERRTMVRLALAATLATVVATGMSLLEPAFETPRRYGLSLMAVTLAFLWPGRPDRFSRRLTPLLFGVYLVHPFIVRVYQGFHVRKLPVSLLSVFVFAAAALTVAAMRRTPLRRLV